MKLQHFVFIFFITSYIHAQRQHTFRFIDISNNLPVDEADVYADTVLIGSTNFNGNLKFDFNKKFNHLIVDHILYEKKVIPFDSLEIKKVYKLKKLDFTLDEVVVDNRSDKDSLTLVKLNFSWGSKAAVYIPFEHAGYINKLKFRVTSEMGVKGLNYLPFKANVYEYDIITKLPGKPLIENDIVIENKNGDAWAVADISAQKIRMPDHGVFIVFIIPEAEFYKTDFINSRFGYICAVPNLRKVPALGNRLSFLYDYYFEGGALIQKWKSVKYYNYKMKIEVGN